MKNLVVGKTYYTPNYGGVVKVELMEIIDDHIALLQIKKVREYMKNRLQEMRWEKNWSQAQLAMRSNVPRSTIGDIENNQFENPRVYTAIKLAHALGVSVEDIFKL